MAVFSQKGVRNIIEKAVSICLIIPQNREVKKFQLHIIDQSFEHNGEGISYQKKLESLEEEKAVHTRQAWCQKDLPTLYQRRTGRQSYVM